jgi:thiosulfate reductase cytochrome b subunit
MADSAVRQLSSVPAAGSHASRHSLTVRVTHWVTVACFLALLVSGCEIVISHPRFYWGETGNVGTVPLFSIHIPSSRGTVPTGYGYVLPDQNGWSRYLHFQSAWIVVLTGLMYAVFGLLNGHFRRDLMPQTGLSLRALRPDPGDAHSYNPLQRLAYLFVIFGLFPLVIWTGLAMSPAFVSAVPAAVSLLGGRQSARTIHFFVSAALVLFLVVHIVMVWLAGFRSRVGAMITGRAAAHQEDR